MVKQAQAAFRSSTNHAWWACGVVVVSTLGVSVAPAVRTQADLGREYFQIGDALSSAGPDKTIEYGVRLFSGDSRERACRLAQADAVAKLVAVTSPLTLGVHTAFWPGHLIVLAYDASGALLPKVPLGVELSAAADVIDRRPHVAPDGILVPLRPAPIRFRLRTICGGSEAEVVLAADIQPVDVTHHGDYITVGHARSSTGLGQPIGFGVQALSEDLRERMCRAAHAADIDRLAPVGAPPLTLRVDTPFSPRRLIVLVYNGLGAILPNVPLTVEVRAAAGVVDLGPLGVGRGLILPRRPGEVTLRVSTVCRGPAVDLFIRAGIRPR